ncbi:hypothetical protein NDI85_21330 [Halomicroarcula sp. S1AR25-4]|uniref:hypothetical protein n=1 Tax=Haloarcula sp. S1AR25-4 TaxID=2950538 RepID=UPI0028752DAD|nr:hypothetical protein [Halomicroarcula sp. S1AR25-4]MDS0280331.1 hypothetical protein [Halomicroarcula sp. S1AR25-4]
MQHADDTQNDTEQRTDPEPHQQLASALRCLADEVERAGRQLATDDVDIVVEDGEATLVHTFDLDVGYDFEADPEGLCEPETVTDGGGEQPDTDIYELDVQLRQSATIAIEATSREEAWDALEHPHERDVQEFLATNGSLFTGALYEPQDVISVGDVEEPDISLAAEGGDA